MSLRGSIVLFGLATLCGSAHLRASVMFGGLGGHSNQDSTNDGALSIVNQNTGALTVVGHPAGVSRITGLVFDLNGFLYGSTQGPGGFPPPPGPTTSSNLIRINPATGALISSVQISDGTNPISIADLALQPGTGVLYGIRSPGDQLGGQGKLYTINKTTGLATLVGERVTFLGALRLRRTEPSTCRLPTSIRWVTR